MECGKGLAIKILFFLCMPQTYNIAKESLNRQNVTPMHQTSVDGVDDMANLGDLHDAAILHNLHLRYKCDKIYVSDGLLHTWW